MYELRGNIAVKARKNMKHLMYKLDSKLIHRISRDEAHRTRELILKAKKQSVVDSRLKKKMEEYCRERFGKTDYWPWLALYTEYRGEFKEGWIPCDYFRFSILPQWNPHSSFSSLKTMDYRLFTDFSVRPVATVINSVIYGPDQMVIDSAKLEEYFDTDDKEFVIKQDGGKGGDKIQFVKKDGLRNLDLNSLGNAVVQPVLKQHASLDQIYSGSVNTVRVATFLESDGRASRKFNILRVGTNGSRVDNTSSGGLFMLLDTEGNIISEAYDNFCIPAGSDHPDSGVAFKSVKIPGVREASEACCRAHEKFPYARFVAWDVCITENGNPVLLEWNTKNPSMWFEEAMLGPFWPDYEF